MGDEFFGTEPFESVEEKKPVLDAAFDADDAADEGSAPMQEEHPSFFDTLTSQPLETSQPVPDFLTENTPFPTDGATSVVC